MSQSPDPAVPPGFRSGSCHVRWVALTLLLGLASGPMAEAATSCFSVSCNLSCSPSPAAVSTLIAPGDFPAEADTPIAFVDPDDGRGRWWIATQQGAILVWDGATGNVLPTFFLDLRDDVGGPVVAGGERGLLALVADPDYILNGRFYVFYTRANLGPGTQGDLVVERYQRSAADPDVADPASATTILVVEHSSAGNHNGGGACDSQQGINGDGQRANSLLGKLLRLDVRGIDPAAGSPDDCGIGPANYTVPSSNPFFGQEPACDEVWALGLRNPFRFSFDRLTGDLYLGDVGQNKWEEINLQRAATPAPVNFGWVCREGCETSDNSSSHCSDNGCPLDTGTTCQFPRVASGFWDPILCHRNPGFRSIIGGYRYRGSFVPSIAGDYLYSDAACGQIWKTDTLDPADPAAISASCWASGFGGTFALAEDRLGELYVVRGGASRIECIHNGEGCVWSGAGIFTDGFESGDVTRWSVTEP